MELAFAQRQSVSVNRNFNQKKMQMQRGSELFTIHICIVSNNSIVAQKSVQVNVLRFEMKESTKQVE